MKRRKKYINVSLQVHNKLTKVRKLYQPKLFLLGKDNKNVVRVALKLHTHRGCEELPAVTSGFLTKRTLEIYNLNFIPCGLARIGRNISYEPKFRSTSGLRKKEFKDGIVLTYLTERAPYGTLLKENSYSNKNLDYRIVH